MTPNELAERVRDVVRDDHAGCHPPHCPLAQIWTSDVAEVLAAADRIRQHESTSAHTEDPVQLELDAVAGAGEQLARAAAGLMREATNYGGCDIPELLRRAEIVQRQLNHWSNVAPRRA